MTFGTAANYAGVGVFILYSYTMFRYTLPASTSFIWQGSLPVVTLTGSGAPVLYIRLGTPRSSYSMTYFAIVASQAETPTSGFDLQLFSAAPTTALSYAFTIIIRNTGATSITFTLEFNIQVATSGSTPNIDWATPASFLIQTAA